MDLYVIHRVIETARSVFFFDQTLCKGKLTLNLSSWIVFLLLIDAAYVFYGLLNKRNMWKFICLYWMLLTMKNYIDYVNRFF